MLERSIALGEASSDPYAKLGRALQLQGNNQARYGLAAVLRAQGRVAEASAAQREFHTWVRYAEQRNILHDRVAVHPDQAQGWFALARLNAKMGLWSTARRLTLSGLRRAPADEAGRQLLAEIDRHAPS